MHRQLHDGVFPAGNRKGCRADAGSVVSGEAGCGRVWDREHLRVEGHFIVLTGITDDGKIKVNDPNDNSSKQHINQAFAVSLILRESKSNVVFE